MAVPSQLALQVEDLEYRYRESLDLLDLILATLCLDDNKNSLAAVPAGRRLNEVVPGWAERYLRIITGSTRSSQKAINLTFPVHGKVDIADHGASCSGTEQHKSKADAQPDISIHELVRHASDNANRAGDLQAWIDVDTLGRYIQTVRGLRERCAISISIVRTLTLGKHCHIKGNLNKNETCSCYLCAADNFVSRLSLYMEETGYHGKEKASYRSRTICEVCGTYEGTPHKGDCPLKD